MKLSFRNWGAKQLLLSWGAYWLALAAVTLTPALALIARISQKGAHGNMSASFDNNLLRVAITTPDGPGWTGAIHFSSLVFLVFVPPLLLWVVWAASRPRRDSAIEPTALLNEAPYDVRAPKREQVSERDGRR